MSVRLDEFDYLEWLDVARKLLPGLTEEKYQEKWEDFQRAKEAAMRRRSMQ